MRKYLSFFRVRFMTGVQYRIAALAGIVTQFVWGGLQILTYAAFYEENAAQFPMTFSALISYVWLQQAFLALFVAYVFEEEIFSCITDGNVSYELCRPMNIYTMWFVRTVANRLSRACLRCIPVLIVAIILPEPYGIHFAASWTAFGCFILSMILSLWVVVSFTMIIYISTFYTVQSQGMRMVFVSIVELASGAVIPLPFMPTTFQKVCEILPFASMQNAPLRIYGGDISGKSIIVAIGLQIFWALVLTLDNMK